MLNIYPPLMWYPEKEGKPIPWAEIAAVFEGRSKDDCRKRWAKIDERWRKGAWDKEEDTLLASAVEQCGNRQVKP